MKNYEISSRVIFIVYRFVLPAFILIFLLIVSQNLKRSLFLGSLGLDIFARIWIILGFYFTYIRLSDLDKYMFRKYGMEFDNSNNYSLPLNWQNIFWGSMHGILSIPITWWTIQVFLPIFSNISWLLALFHGMLLSIPIIIRRTKFIP
jgi:hypothetical protein